jgi:hypothetical protein
MFALQYRMAIDEIAGNKTANLRQYELSDKEWAIAEQLVDTLKVRTSSLRLLTHWSSSRGTLVHVGDRTFSALC